MFNFVAGNKYIMMEITRFIKGLFGHKYKKVALVLSGGGARGYAHIGAIEELLAQGYEITSVAGSSMGAFIGAMYASGHLEDIKKWFTDLDNQKIRSLVDISLGLNHVVKGDKLMNDLEKFIPDMDIEEMKIPFMAVSTNLTTGEEEILDHGSMWQAVRASISIPGFFKPVKEDGDIFVDGCVLNPLPLNLVKREKGDLLACVNVIAGHDSAGTCRLEDEVADIIMSPSDAQQSKWGIMSFLRSKFPRPDLSDNAFNMSLRMSRLMVQRNAMLMEALYHPDICVNIPMEKFGLFDFTKAAVIMEEGRADMREVLDILKNSSPKKHSKKALSVKNYIIL